MGLQPGNGDSRGPISYADLQNKLQSRSYFQTFSSESVALVARLLGDLSYSGQQCQELKSRISEHERESGACLQELELLKREHPRLLKENTELHQRLLSDTDKHAQQKIEWEERIKVARNHLTNVQRLHEVETARSTELHQTTQLLRSHIAELNRLGASDGAAASGVRIRLPAIVLQGKAIPSANQNLRENSDEVDVGPVLHSCDMIAKLALQRQARSEQAARLSKLESQAIAARTELERLQQYGVSSPEDDYPQDLAGSETPLVVDRQLHTEESHLVAHANFLERKCGILENECQSVGSTYAQEKRRFEFLTSTVGTLNQEISAARHYSEPDASGVAGEPASPWSFAAHQQTGEYAILEHAHQERLRELEVYEETQVRLSAEVEQARSNILECEVKTGRLQEEEENIRLKSREFDGAHKRTEQDLAEVQANHRKVSSSVQRLIPELRHWRAERVSEMIAENECQVLVDDACGKLQRSEVAQELAENTCVDEGRRLREALAEVRSGNVSIAQSEHNLQLELLRCIGKWEPNVDTARAELQQLRQELSFAERRLQTTRLGAVAVGSNSQRKAGRLEAIVAELSAVEERQEDDLWCMNSLRAQVGASSEVVYRLERSVEQCRMTLQEDEKSLAELTSFEEAEARTELSANATVASMTKQISELGVAQVAAQESISELEERKLQLASLLSSLEETRENLLKRSRDFSNALQDELRLKQDALKGPQDVRSRLAEITVASNSMRETISNLDAERSTLCSLALSHLQKKREREDQSVKLQSVRSDWQWKIDRLKHVRDLQQGALDECLRESEASTGQVETLEATVESAKRLAQERQRDAKFGLDDLTNMTRENQVLSEELMQVKRRFDRLLAGSEEQEALALPFAQRIQGAEMERDHVRDVYKRAIEEQQRNAMAIVQLRGRLEQDQAELESVSSNLVQAQAREMDNNSCLLDKATQLKTLRARISGTTLSLESFAQSQEDSAAVRACMQQMAGANQAALSAAYVGDAAADAELDTLRIEVQTLELELQQAQERFATARRDIEQAREQQQHVLQDMILPQRFAQQRVEEENALLRKNLEERRNSSVAGGEVSERSPQSFSPSALQSTLEEQRALVEVMSAEGRGLKEEVQELQQMLAKQAESQHAVQA